MQAVLVAVSVYHADLIDLESRFRACFGMRFHYLNPAGRNRCKEADVVLLGHGMLDPNEKLVFEPMRETRTGESGASQPIST